MPPFPMTEIDLPPGTASEQDLVQIARDALSRCNWIVGKCAAEWTQRYARGRTDADFAQLVGLSSDQVFQRRRVWETFGDVYEDYPALRWSHFYIAVNWDDSAECLQWADENGATVAEMRAWRRAMRGEDVAEAEVETAETSLGDDPAIARLAVIPADVRTPDDEYSARRFAGENDRPRSRDDEDAPFAPSTVSSANREKAGDEGDYAPFRRDAGSKPPADSGGDEIAEEKPVSQIAKRVISTLERIVGVLSPQIVAGFRSLPEKDRQRLATVVRTLAERIEALAPKQPS